MTFCPHCDFMNSDQNIYCASCGKPLKNQSVEIERVAPTHPPPSNVERNAIAGCCVLSILLFFFPLLTIHVPIAGEQDVSGYDVFSKLTEFREKLKPPDGSQTNPYSATPRTPPPDMPLSIQLGWLTPLQSELKGNPYAGLAENISTLILNAFQIKPGWGVYALLVLLGLAAVLGFSRVLSRLRVAQAGS